MLNFTIEDNGVMQRLKGIALNAETIPIDTMRGIGELIVDSQLENFVSGGRPTQWKQTIRGNPPLRSPQDKLMQSVKVSEVSNNSVEVSMGEGLPYTYIHEFGGKIPVTVKSRKFFWAKWYESGKSDQIWKNMALTKKSFFEMPARRYFRLQDQDVTNIVGQLSQYLITGTKSFETRIG